MGSSDPWQHDLNIYFLDTAKELTQFAGQH